MSAQNDPLSEDNAGVWLQQRHARHTVDRNHWLQIESTWSWSRLAIFAAVPVTWLLSGTQPLIAVAVTAALIPLFALAVRRHHSCRSRREHFDRLLMVLDEAKQRCGGSIICIRDARRPVNNAKLDELLPRLIPTGETAALTDQERDDLDLFSPPVGIFGLLNRASTLLGQRCLRDWLDNPCLEPAPIIARQSAIAWLRENSGPRVDLMAACAALRKEDDRLTRLMVAIHTARADSVPKAAGALRIWSIISLILAFTLAALAFAVNLVWGGLLGALLVVNTALYLGMRSRLVDALRPWRDVEWAARGLWIVSRQAALDLPAVTDLATLRNPLSAVAPSDVLGRLSHRVGWTESGGMFHALLNVVGFADLHIACSILRVVVKHRDNLKASAAALGELEAYLSVACFAWEQPVVCVPQVITSPGAHLEIKRGVHPLVPPERVVANDVVLSPQTRIWIITGSNMAGKSTFLRMVGVNVLLAQIGAPALAESMRWTPARLISDLRARDSLSANESYFLSEVRHLRRMIVPTSGNAPIIGLIDEPFRGTNSQDQTAASVAVVKHLLASPNLFLLATHDRNLTLLADGAAARNFHFRENLGSNGMVFDYAMHEGPATTRNALRILEREGYPLSLVADAHEWQKNNAD